MFSIHAQLTPAFSTLWRRSLGSARNRKTKVKQNSLGAFQEGEGDLEQGLSRSDWILIFSMLLASRDRLVPLSEDTVVGGQPLRNILQFAGSQLTSALKPRNADASDLWALLVRVTTSSIASLSQNGGRCQPLRARQVYVRDIMRCSRTTIRLVGRLLRYDTFLID